MAQQAVTTATQAIPAEAFQLAAANHLGTPTAVYKGGIPAFELVVSVVFLGLGTWVGIAIFSTQSNGTAINPLGVLLFALLIGGWGLLWPIRYLLNLSLRVYVCTNGLLRVKGDNTVAIRWDQVESVTQSYTLRRFGFWIPACLTGGVFAVLALRSMFPVYKVRRADGVQIKLHDGISKVKALGTTVLVETSNVLLPRMIASLRAGSSVSFGLVTATQQGLTKGNKTLPWAECDGVVIARGGITIKKRGGNVWNGGAWYSSLLRRVPNFAALAGLIAAMKSGQP